MEKKSQCVQTVLTQANKFKDKRKVNTKLISEVEVDLQVRQNFIFDIVIAFLKFQGSVFALTLVYIFSFEDG